MNTVDYGESDYNVSDDTSDRETIPSGPTDPVAAWDTILSATEGAAALAVGYSRTVGVTDPIAAAGMVTFAALLRGAAQTMGTLFPCAADAPEVPR